MLEATHSLWTLGFPVAQCNIGMSVEHLTLGIYTGCDNNKQFMFSVMSVLTFVKYNYERIKHDKEEWHFWRCYKGKETVLFFIYQIRKNKKLYYPTDLAKA